MRLSTLVPVHGCMFTQHSRVTSTVTFNAASTSQLQETTQLYNALSNHFSDVRSRI